MSSCRTHLPAFLLTGAAVLGLGIGPSFAAGRTEAKDRAAYIRSHYAKYEFRIPMRDGVRLFTAVYVPNDTSQRYPFLLLRTPYSIRNYGSARYAPTLAPSEAFEKAGYIFVFQDVRGRFMSEGKFVQMRPHVPKQTPKTKGSGRVGPIDESTDTWDTIQWLLDNVPRHNGRVGMSGISYPGFYTSAGAIDSHPALRAISPQAPIADWFWDDFHHHGAFILSMGFGFFAHFPASQGPTMEQTEIFDHETPDAYEFFMELGPLRNINQRLYKNEIPFWNEIVAHPNYDAFWQARNILPHLKNVRAACLVVGGWYDAEDLFGPLATFRAISRQNRDTPCTLVMGPWIHGGWHRTSGDKLGDANFGYATSPDFVRDVEMPFFEHHLRQAEDPRLPRALMFETGANRWRRFDSWPPREAKPLHLYPREDGGLAFEPPTKKTGADQFISDPNKPVPYTQAISRMYAKTYPVEDQRFASRRPDVLVYRTPPLAEDVTLAGPLLAQLWVATDKQAADWIVKLIDVYPSREPGTPRPTWARLSGRDGVKELGGMQQLVRGEVLRGRFRNSYEKPEPFIPDQPTPVTFELQDILHTFKRGHRIMVQVQSTWFPFVDRNPQSWVPNIFAAEEKDFVRATHTLFRSRKRASRIRVHYLARRDGFPIKLAPEEPKGKMPRPR